MPEWRHYEAAALGPLVPGLRALEAGIPYPIEDGTDHFTIDHGEDYAAFYRGLGDAHYLVARDGEQIVGSIAGALRDARVGERRVPAVYLGDLKVAAPYRGTGVARQLAFGCVRMMRQRRFRQWRLVYFAAMRGARGDVSRALRGFNPGRFLRPAAVLQLYFVPPETLRRLDPSTAPPAPETRGVDLSPTVDADRVSTAGRKDLRIASTGRPWPLVHLPRGPRAWGGSLGTYLARCAAADWAPGELACFGLDARLIEHTDWLTFNGLKPGAVCTIHTLAWPGVLRGVRWMHLATSEI